MLFFRGFLFFGVFVWGGGGPFFGTVLFLAFLCGGTFVLSLPVVVVAGIYSQLTMMCLFGFGLRISWLLLAVDAG